MKNETKRFLVILTCVFVGFLLLDVAVKIARVITFKSPMNGVKVGMSEVNLIRLTGKKPADVGTGKKEIFIQDKKPESMLESVFCHNSSCWGSVVEIQTGVVVSVRPEGVVILE